MLTLTPLSSQCGISKFLVGHGLVKILYAITALRRTGRGGAHCDRYFPHFTVHGKFDGVRAKVDHHLRQKFSVNSSKRLEIGVKDDVLEEGDQGQA